MAVSTDIQLRTKQMEMHLRGRACVRVRVYVCTCVCVCVTLCVWVWVRKGILQIGPKRLKTSVTAPQMQNTRWPSDHGCGVHAKAGGAKQPARHLKASTRILVTQATIRMPR